MQALCLAAGFLVLAAEQGILSSASGFGFLAGMLRTGAGLGEVCSVFSREVCVLFRGGAVRELSGEIFFVFGCAFVGVTVARRDWVGHAGLDAETRPTASGQSTRCASDVAVRTQAEWISQAGDLRTSLARLSSW